MNADWEEVKKLAFDFQRTQAMISVQKLSERNCIDIVKRLIEMKLIDVIFTNDGKEYLTSEHLTREIENELYAAGGRIAISDLVSVLNVDYGPIELRANQLARNSSGEINIVLDQLISKDYKDSLTSEIDLTLQEAGTLVVTELSKQFDLPTEFLLNMLEERVGVLIKATLDKSNRTLYTNDYLARYESRIQGIFSGITRPVTVQSIVNRYSIPEKILTKTLESLLSKKRITGSISGPTYIPEIYSKNQSEYISNFYKHNRYLEFSTLAKLGISNAPVFLQKMFNNEIIPLDSCAVDRLLFFQIETTIEDCIQNHSFSDICQILPSVLNSEDIDILIKKCLENNKQLAQETIVLCDTIVVTKNFIEKIKNCFHDTIKKRAEEDLKTGAILAYYAKGKSSGASDDKRKSMAADLDESSGKKKGGKKGAGGGAGSQGREVKTKATKKKYKAGKGGKDDFDDDEADQKSSLKFLKLEKIIEIVTKSVKKEKDDADELDETFFESLAEFIEESLQKKYEAYAQELFATHNAEASKGKMSFGELEKMVNDTLTQVGLFAKTLEKFDSDVDLKSKLEKHLQKTLCSDIVNSLVIYFSPEEILSTTLTQDSRVKHINKIDETEVKDALIKINTSLNSQSVVDFVQELDDNSKKLGLMIKRQDKKREKNILSENRQALICQFSECKDPIVGLHLAVLIVFQVIHDAMLHASGKFVPQILHFIDHDLSPELREKFRMSQDLIMKSVNTKHGEEQDQLQTQLQELFNEYQSMVPSFKKVPKEQ